MTTATNSVPAQIGICGGGAWGTALAHTLARRGLDVTLWSRKTRTHPSSYFDATLDSQVNVTNKIGSAASAPIVILAVPTGAMHEVAQAAEPYIASGAIVVSAAKGFEAQTDRTMSQMLKATLRDGCVVAALSGPNLAPEIVRGLPAAIVIAAEVPAAAEQVRDTCTGDQLRWYSSTDLVGVEFAGALKNVIAIASGICDGIEVGDNGKAAIITRGLAEVARLGMRAGADPLTFAGLAGVGDCLATCMSPLSRNRSFGYAIAKGYSAEKAEEEIGTVEGINATRAALRLAVRYEVEVPIANAVADVLFEGKPVAQAMAELMGRDPADELPT